MIADINMFYGSDTVRFGHGNSATTNTGISITNSGSIVIHGVDGTYVIIDATYAEAILTELLTVQKMVVQHNGTNLIDRIPSDG